MKRIFVTNQLKLAILIFLAFGLVSFVGGTSVWADTFTYSATFSNMDEITESEIHDDLGLPNEEAKGSATFTFTNSTSQAWGDFHFKINSGTAIFDPNETPLMDSVAFDSEDYQLSNGNQNLDLYFYDNPVAVGDIVTFTIYTDNTEDQGFFGMCFQPSAVPIPSAVWLFGSALLGLVGIRKKFGRS